jgi:hypothetical protein
MDELRLRDWELPLGCRVPLCAPADAEAHGGKISAVEVEKDVFWLFFQPKNEWLSNYVVTRLDSVAPSCWKVRESVAELASIIQAAKRQDKYSLARFFHFGAPHSAAVILSKHQGGWVSAGSMTPFRVWANLQERASPQVYEWVLQQWHKPTSEVHFAWQWAQRSEEKRIQFLYPEKGGIHELSQLLRWVLQSDAQLLELAEEYLDPVRDMVLPLNGHCKQPRESDPSTGTVIPVGTFHALRWQSFLRRYFFPLPPLKRARRELCIKEFDRRMRGNPHGRSGR